MLAFDHRAAGDDHVVALAVELDELELEFLAFQVHRVAHRAHVDQRTRQERADVLDVDGEAALDPPLMRPTMVSFFSSASSSSSHTMARLAFSREEDGFAEAVFEAVEGDLDFVADADVDSPASLRNCSIGTMPSDFRPALITTTSLRTSTTVPLTMAPGLILPGWPGWLRTVLRRIRSCNGLVDDRAARRRGPPISARAGLPMAVMSKPSVGDRREFATGLLPGSAWRRAPETGGKASTCSTTAAMPCPVVSMLTASSAGQRRHRAIGIAGVAGEISRSRPSM